MCFNNKRNIFHYWILFITKTKAEVIMDNNNFTNCKVESENISERLTTFNGHLLVTAVIQLRPC